VQDPAEPNVRGNSDTFNALYDRQADPWETRNLFHDPAYGELRQQLHAQTLDFMQRFGDPGWSNNRILQQVICSEDLDNVLAAPGKRPVGWEGRLQGRPVDILQQLESSSGSK
jgi:hypothetical protein